MGSLSNLIYVGEQYHWFGDFYFTTSNTVQKVNARKGEGLKVKD